METLNICFLLPSNSISGGIFTVYKHASFLKQLGHKITIGLIREETLNNPIPYPGMDGITFKEVSKLYDNAPFDIVVATWWETLFLLPRIKANHYLYFVQGFEDEFYEKNSLPAFLISVTYKESIHFATISKALACRLENKSHLVPCGIDLDLFHNAEAAIPGRGMLRVLVEGLPNDERKQVENTLNILSEFENIEVVYISPYGKPDYETKIDFFFQSVPHEQMPSLYKSCDFLVKLSTTESVALPVIEMFASGGTAVVSSFKGHDEYIRDRDNAIVVPLGNREKTISAIQELITDHRLRDKLKDSARETAKSFNLLKSNQAFEQTIQSLMKDCKGCDEPNLIKRYIPDYQKFEQALIKL